MAQIKLQQAYRVDLMEYERGWGHRLDEPRYYDSEEEARDFVARFNAENTEEQVPDWYMVAVYRGKVS